MENVFITVLNMSITASYFAAALIALRFIFRKLPKWISCVLWGLVGLRLILPFSFESILSLIPSAQTVPTDIMYQKTPHITSGIPALNFTVNPVINEAFAPKELAASVNPLQVVLFILSVLWIAGTVLMLIYTLISYLVLKRKTRERIRTEKGVYICDNIDSPFILGIIKPEIYLPSSVSDYEKEFIISHEKAHIRRLDHLWKPLGFVLLSVYWFNPVLWAAYIFLCRDIEAACDEKVLKEKGEDMKKAYSEILLNFSAPKKLITACPLAFGETGIKTRIKNILNYRKPAFWVVAGALILSIILSALFMTNPNSGIDSIDGCKDIFRDAQKLQFFISTDSFVYTTEDPSDELKEIKKIRLERTALDESREENRDKTYSIEIDDKITIYFDNSFSKLWVDDNVKPSYTYGITNPDVVKNLFVSIRTPEDPVIGTETSPLFTDFDGVYLTLKSIDTNPGGYKVFNITWNNTTDKDITYGEFYDIEKLNGESWESVAKEELIFVTIGYILKAGTTAEKSYSAQRFDISKTGKYRLIADFSAGDGNSYRTYITFNVSDGSVTDIGGLSGPVTVVTTKKLTLDDVIRLSKKGDKLTWKDFEDFTYYETGSGLYIREYVIDERFSLSIGGTTTDTDAWYFYLHAPGTYSDAKIDIRSEDPEEFIDLHKDFSVVKFLSYSQRSFPVDNTGENFQTFIDYGCFVPTNQSSIQHFPVIMIESRKELDDFVEYFNDKADLDNAFQDMGLTFRELSYLYDTEYKNFFEDNVLFITYMVATNEDAYFEMDFAAVANKTLTIAAKEVNWTASVDKYSATGWFIISEISKDQLGEIESVSAYRTPEEPDYGDDLHSATYTFKASSNEILKPNFKLYENGKFVFTFHPYTGYFGQGNYEIYGDTLTLSTDDGFVYSFKEKNGVYIFDAKNSSDELWMSDIKDGSEFRY